ncbi:MAG: LysR family transcriptional regulator [Ramlibacter sp.]
MIQIEDLRLVAALSRAPSLSAAARALDVTPPALSMRLKKLEAALGVSLAVRSAHRMSLTAEGEQLAAQAAGLLAQLEDLPESLQREGRALSGSLRVAAPFGFGRRHVAPLLAAFARQHPRIAINLDLMETPWPDRRDADLVVHIGNVRDSSWVAHPLAANERWLCASPAFVKAQRFAPNHPREVLGQPCICIRENEEDVTLWHYRKRGGRKAKPGRRESLRIAPLLTSNDGDVARQWCEQGLGLVLRSQWDAAPAVAAGTLVRLLEGWAFDSAPVQALVPTRKGATARVRALVQFLQQAFHPRPPW